MIAAANPHASEAGREMLRAGGSAVDAAIAAQLVLTLVEPESSGIGGGVLMLLYDPGSKSVTSFDGRETAPASAKPGMFLGPDGKARPGKEIIPGGLSVGVPGTLAALELAHRKYGKLPWKTLFEPAIRLAQDGFKVGPKLAHALKASPFTTTMPDMRRYFLKANGEPYAEGEILKNPEYARTLRAIAAGGSKVFYSGKIAAEIVAKINHAPMNPAGMTLKDIATYHAAERRPVCGPFRVYRICSMGPPSSGGIAILQILGMLERFPPEKLVPNSLSEVHLFSQASRLAYADRAKYLADSDFIYVPIKGLLDRNYLAERAKLIDETKDMGKAQAGDPPGQRADYAPQRSIQLPGTSHLSVVDDKGQAVSLTMTIESAFGSGLMAGGFMLNNELTDFSRDPMLDGKEVANAPAPGKRPLSAMSPALVFGPDGKFLIAAGSPGGPLIISYVAQALLAMLDHNVGPQDATALPHHINMNGSELLEKGTGLEAMSDALKAMGYDVKSFDLESGLQIIKRVPEGYLGGADPRRDGVALGD
jgi:gamma-glutamyltranspeptidase/glutathione hydrolase